MRSRSSNQKLEERSLFSIVFSQVQLTTFYCFEVVSCTGKKSCFLCPMEETIFVLFFLLPSALLNSCLPETPCLFSSSWSHRLLFHRQHTQNIWNSSWNHGHYEFWWLKMYLCWLSISSSYKYLCADQLKTSTSLPPPGKDQGLNFLRLDRSNSRPLGHK